ncbi:hypothetical protein QBC45DRAFT_481955 [Copromyces sp. CBS 386.78]|nr:hypothetical protein QBC45DRAFT_481955 [Copromyces sp. CBS 386.78]
MQLLSVIFLPVLLFASQATAATWYFLRYNTPSGAKFTAFSGQMVIPALPKAANVLDGRSGIWWFGSGWCCSNPSLPWGGGFNTYAGETNSFSNVLNSDGSGWTTTTTRGTNGSPVTNTFPLGNTNSAWCTGKPENYNSATKYTISGAKASVSGTTVICTIDSVVLQGPA